MRVISGSARGLKLRAPEGLETRPTTDRIKESLFNIIADRLCEAEFLDLFGGSGAIGIEALSRGAKRAVFVDKSRKSADVIRSNLSMAKVAERAEVLCMDIAKAFPYLKSKGSTFDVIFADPPYFGGYIAKTLALTAECELLAPDGILIAEQSVDEECEHADAFEIFRVKDYKRTTKMTFYKWSDLK